VEPLVSAHLLRGSPDPVFAMMNFPLACPKCQAALARIAADRWRCVQGHEFPVVQGTPLFTLGAGQSSDGGNAAYFERLYQSETEPWLYTQRGAEILKYQFLLEAVRGLCGGSLEGRTLIDVGCSLGGLTNALAGAGGNVLAVDVSETAVRKSRDSFEKSERRGTATFVVGCATSLPCAPKVADVVVLSDGLRSWRLTEVERLACLDRVASVLRCGGSALFLDYMNPRHFPGFIQTVNRTPFHVSRVVYLGDRLFYNVERVLSRAGLLRRSVFFRFMVGSVGFARLLRAVSNLAGPRGSKHLCVVVRRV